MKRRINTLRWAIDGLIVLAGICLSACAAAATPTAVPSKLAKEIVFYDWEGDMPQSVLDAFTKEYGVKVKYETYASSEEGAENLLAGKVYDVVVMESRLIPLLTQENLLAQIDYKNVPNFKNISLNFRDLVYDPGNKHAIPYNWGTTGIVVRNDLVTQPITSWKDLWNPRFAGKVGMWQGQPREMIGIALKSLEFSANSEKPAELEQALARLLELKPGVVFYDDYNMVSAAEPVVNGQVIIGMGYALDVLDAREKIASISYVLPKEGALLWGDNFAIPTKSTNQATAEALINFFLRPEINAQIANENRYATPNEAAFPFIKSEILNDPVIFPPQTKIQNAEIILPLGPAGQKLYDGIWLKFLNAK